MSEELLILIGWVAGIATGWWLREWAAIRHLSKMIQNAREEFDHDQPEITIVKIAITTVDDVYFVHNEETGEFLAQGKTHEEITNILQKRYPNTTFTATHKNLQEVGYKKNDAV